MSAPDLFSGLAQPASRVAPATSTRRSIGNRRLIAFIVYDVEEGDPRTIRPVGRDAQTLARLLHARSTGITSLERPTPRLSHYIFKLRSVYALNIETVTEPHGGEFAGRHAVYVLRSNVAFADPADAAAFAEDRR